MKSMTGYGKGEATSDGKTITVELKSVNHRFLDISIRNSYSLSFCEDVIRKTLQSRFARGHIDCFVSLYDGDTSGVKEYAPNYKQIESYLSIAEELRDKCGIERPLSTYELLKLPSSLVEKPSEDNQDLLIQLLNSALNDACNGLEDMRAKEGDNLKVIVNNHLENIAYIVMSVKEKAPTVVATYREKLRARLSEYLKEVQPDEARLLTEVAIFTDKVNIDEEINHLYSHISQFHDLIELNSPIGKKLDFLVQEMNRETNTIGSKANNVEITKNVVDMKNEIEKLREQIQNIE